MQKLSALEIAALELLALHGGSVLTSEVGDVSSRGVFGERVPGHSTFKQLEKLGLCFYTEEEPVSDLGGPLDGFIFTNEIYLTEEGKAELKGRAL